MAFVGTMVAGMAISSIGYAQGSYGTLSATTDVNGNTITSVQDNTGVVTFTLTIASASTLAQNYFDSISVTGGAVNATLQSSAASFSGGGGSFTWSWAGILGLVNTNTYTVGLNTNGNTAITAASPVNGNYAFAFAPPTNCLRVLAAGDQDFSFPGIDLSDYRSLPTADDYLVEGGLILSNQAAPLSLKFIAQVTNVALWDACFCDAIGARLAYRGCFRITNSLNQQKMAQADYMKAIQEAARAGAIEGPPIFVADDSWVLTRPIGSGGAPTTRIG